jgi:protein-tyrosine phosphatase
MELKDDLKHYASEILPLMWLGGEKAGRCKKSMKKLGITHILVAGSELECYWKDKFIYLQVPIEDRDDQDIVQYLKTTRSFIDCGLNSGGILIHCQMGQSRSATIVMDYLLRRGHFDSFISAKQHMKSVHPPTTLNKGFEKMLRKRYPVKNK